jgi:hypothetical protein
MIDLSVRQQVEALYKSGYLPAVIATQTGLKKTTIATWADRYHWRESRDKVVRQNENGVAATVAYKLERRSSELRDSISAELLDQAQMLRQYPPKSVGSLINGRSATVKTIVDSGDKLFGWNKQDGPGCMVQVGIVAQFMPQEPPAKPAIEPAGSV